MVNGKLLVICNLHSFQIASVDECTKTLFENFQVEILYEELQHTGTLISEENINEKQMKDLIGHVKRQYESPVSFQRTDKNNNQMVRISSAI